MLRQLSAGFVLAWGIGVGAAQAQSVPQIQEFYFDADSAATPMLVVDAEAPDLVDQLMKQRERGRRMLDATVQLAGVALAQGRTELGESLYQEALSTASANSVQGRSVRWNHGWDVFRAGDVDAALNHWSEAQATLRGNASWVPTTFAMALWSQGRRDEAVKWYAAAVRTEPKQWSSTEGFAQQLPTWRDSERATLAEVHAAWVANPPAWP